MAVGSYNVNGSTTADEDDVDHTPWYKQLWEIKLTLIVILAPIVFLPLPILVPSDVSYFYCFLKTRWNILSSAFLTYLSTCPKSCRACGLWVGLDIRFHCPKVGTNTIFYFPSFLVIQ